MVDSRFFINQGSLSIKDVLRITGATLAPGQESRLQDSVQFKNVAALETAGAEDLCFLENSRYIKEFLAENKAGGCFVHSQIIEEHISDSGNPDLPVLFVSERPRGDFAKVATAFYPNEEHFDGVSFTVSEYAFVDPEAKLADGVHVEPGAVIRKNAEIGKGTYIGSNVVIGQGVIIGEDCMIGDGSVLSHTILGDRVSLLRNASIGQRGFGFDSTAAGHFKIPQLGRVLIGSDVEMGANVAIDRGSSKDTVIADHVMLDNLVHIAHNVEVGRGSVFTGQVGIAGSTKIGQFVVIGAQSGVTGHIQIADGVTIAAKSGVTKEVSAGEIVAGYPAVPINVWKKQIAMLRRLVRNGQKKKKG
ncbi:MAG: UDP-3-O-(3-hydroxymyristoyl)glucosamine N-acyltransferase [Alphaproteobacteria bacterium]